MSRLKKINIIYTVILIVGGILCAGGTYIQNTILTFIGFSCIVGAVIYRLLIYRCPHCGKYLDRSKGQYCPYCREDVNKF